MPSGKTTTDGSFSRRVALAANDKPVPAHGPMAPPQEAAPAAGDETDDLLLAADDVAEEFVEDEQDAAMESDSDGPDEEAEEGESMVLDNDAVAYFDLAHDALFAVAQHPVQSSLVAVGGSGGPDDEAPGAGWLLHLGGGRGSDEEAARRIEALFALDGHSDSISALCWSLPRGEVLFSGGLDGRLRAWRTQLPAAPAPGRALEASLLAEAREVEEINWLAACPSPAHPGAVALGASDGSVWIYAVEADAGGSEAPLAIVGSYFLHTASCTAGGWTPDGQLLATVSEDGSVRVWDVWGQAAAQGLPTENGMTVVSLTSDDQRFRVDGGLYSVAVDPAGAFVAVGGAGGAVKIVSLPRLAGASSSAGGQLLASLQTQQDSVESLAMSLVSAAPPVTLLAAGSVDGSIAVYDASRRFALRRQIPQAHDGQSVVKLDFLPRSWLLTSCGMDGVVRRWDLRRAGSSPDERGLHKEWRGHRAGVLAFVQTESGDRILTAGDDSLALVFEA